MENAGRETWVVRIESAMISARDLIRIEGVGMMAEAEDASAIWIKLEGERGLVEPLSSTLPGERWRVIDGQLHAPNKRVPTALLPDLRWRSVREVVGLQVPRPAVAARFSPNQRRNIQLVRGGSERRCGGLIASIDRLIEWVEAVPDVRLKGLNWVAEHQVAAESETLGLVTGRCVIVGERLPPIAGKLMVVEQKVLIPAGFRWEPPVSIAQVRLITGTQPNHWLVWESTDAYTHVHDEDFDAMNRASVRSLRNQKHLEVSS